MKKKVKTSRCKKVLTWTALGVTTIITAVVAVVIIDTFLEDSKTNSYSVPNDGFEVTGVNMRSAFGPMCFDDDDDDDE